MAGYKTNLPFNAVTCDVFVDNFFNCIEGIFLLFGGISGWGYPALSVKGISYMIRFVIVLLLFFIPFLVKSNYELFKEKEEYIVRVFIYCALNFFVLIFTATTYGSTIFEQRYHIIWTVVLLISDVYFLSVIFKEKCNIWTKRCVMFVILLSLVIINVEKIKEMVSFYDGEAYQEQLSYLKEADEMQVDNIIVYEDLKLAHVMNALDIDKNVMRIQFSTDGNCTVIQDGWGNFLNRPIDNHHMFMVNEENLGEIPQEILSHYTEVTVMNGWYIYETKNYALQ